jgi:hypothetical protein
MSGGEEHVTRAEFQRAHAETLGAIKGLKTTIMVANAPRLIAAVAVPLIVSLLVTLGVEAAIHSNPPATRDKGSDYAAR